MMIVFQSQKKKNYFTTKELKKSCVIGEVKAKFFANNKPIFISVYYSKLLKIK